MASSCQPGVAVAARDVALGVGERRAFGSMTAAAATRSPSSFHQVGAGAR